MLVCLCSCRRNSFVVVGDDEDIQMGLCEAGAGEGSRRGKGWQDPYASSERDGGESAGRNRETDDKSDKELSRAHGGKKRGRKPKERVEESESDDDESDEDEGEVRKKGKKGRCDGSKESREEEEALRLKKEKESARRQREKEQEEREREKEREKERERQRQRAQEEEAEANMTQVTHRHKRKHTTIVSHALSRSSRPHPRIPFPGCPTSLEAPRGWEGGGWNA